MGHDVLTLSQLLSIVGPDFKDEVALAQHLGIRSIRLVNQLLMKWKAALETTEMELLTEYCVGSCVANPKDSFPRLSLAINVEGIISPFFKNSASLCKDFFLSAGKSLYRSCVLVFSKNVLSARVDTPWRDVFKLDEGVKPEWSSLYKPPLTKRTGDLQWKIIHGAVAVNAFVSVLNPEVDSGCPFCSTRETIFHVFMNCCRLQPLFEVVSDVFMRCNETFSLETFILGYKYVRKKSVVCQLLNFVLGQAKLAIFLSRKKKIEQNLNQNMVALFSNLVKSRVMVD